MRCSDIPVTPPAYAPERDAETQMVKKHWQRRIKNAGKGSLTVPSFLTTANRGAKLEPAVEIMSLFSSKS